MLKPHQCHDLTPQGSEPKGRRTNVLGGIVLGLVGVFYGLLTLVIFL